MTSSESDDDVIDSLNDLKLKLKESTKKTGNNDSNGEVIQNAIEVANQDFRNLFGIIFYYIEPQVHKFWNTMPVIKPNEKLNEDDFGPISAVQTVEEVRNEPYSLPSGFKWVVCDIQNEVDRQEIYEFLKDHYVEDIENLFRFNYSSDFLKWAIAPHDYVKDWHIGVKVKSSNKLIGFITAIPCKLSLNSHIIDAAEVNFLCVHKKLRSKRLAPVLIKEITRRVNLKGIWQAIYTAGVIIPTPIATCRYWHRPLDIKKLVQVGFSALSNRLTMSMAIRLYKLPDIIPDYYREMCDSDVPQVHGLFIEYLKNYKIHAVWSEDDIRHWFIPNEDVNYTYVKETDGVITDVTSFYNLPSSIIKSDKHKILNIAYSYYHIANSISLEQLINDTLIIAKLKKFDVFNMIDMMENKKVFERLKFGQGDGYLHYYLFNWKFPQIKPNEVAIVLM